jgi:hypothetical protein
MTLVNARQLQLAAAGDGQIIHSTVPSSQTNNTNNHPHALDEAPDWYLIIDYGCFFLFIGSRHLQRTNKITKATSCIR